MLEHTCHRVSGLVQREVDVNIAGFLGFVMYNLVAFIGITHCFYITSSGAVSLNAVLNIP